MTREEELDEFLEQAENHGHERLEQKRKYDRERKRKAYALKKLAREKDPLRSLKLP